MGGSVGFLQKKKTAVKRVGPTYTYIYIGVQFRKKGPAHILTYFQLIFSLPRLPLNPHRIPNSFRRPDSAAMATRTCT